MTFGQHVSSALDDAQGTISVRRSYFSLAEPWAVQQWGADAHRGKG